MNTLLPSVARRDLLAGLAGIAAVLPAAVAMATPEEPAGQSAQEKENLGIVAAYCAAWSTRNLSKVFEYLADDCIYRMSENTPPVSGHRGVAERLQSYIDASDRVEFRVLETYACGPLVVNHRIDSYDSKTRPIKWEGVGVFYLKDGKIKEWSDYTIRLLS